MKLSIITVNLNNAAGLQKTIESVVSQTFTDFEFLVIDGGSTDGSVEVIKRYADRITWWVSEPDWGIFHAMNKGILQAKGDYCQFLNSGDWFLQPDGLQQVFDYQPQVDICYCDVQAEKEKRIFDDRLSLLTFFEGTISHQASFIKRSLFAKHGLYNEAFKIVSDWEFYIKTIIIAQCSYQHIPVTLIYFDINGISCYKENGDLNEREREKVINAYFPMMFEVYQRFRTMQFALRYYNGLRIIRWRSKIGKVLRLFKQYR